MNAAPATEQASQAQPAAPAIQPDTTHAGTTRLEALGYLAVLLLSLAASALYPMGFAS